MIFELLSAFLLAMYKVAIGSLGAMSSGCILGQLDSLLLDNLDEVHKPAFRDIKMHLPNCGPVDESV